MIGEHEFKAMFTLYRIVKRSVAEIVPERASVHTRNTTTEQDYFAPVLRDVIPATQRNTCSSSHCTGSVSAALRFIIWRVSTILATRSS